MMKTLKIFIALVMLSAIVSCDAPPLERYMARQKVTIHANFLTEDPENIIFPVKVLFAIDCSGSMGGTAAGIEGGSDPEGLRLDAEKS